jgi:hypothetical protein
MRTRLSYANVMATIAVFVALGGSSYAAVTLTGKDIKDGTLTGKDVRDRSLTAKDFKGSVAGPQGKRGRTGATGAQGLQGAAGPQGAVGAAGPQGPKGDTPLAGPRGYSYEVGGQFTAPVTDYTLEVTPEAPAAARNLTCLVISTIQVRAYGTVHPDESLSLRNAVFLDGVEEQDGQPGQYLTYTGPQSFYQPAMTRSSIISVPAGKRFSFGVEFDNNLSDTQPDAYADDAVSAVTSYACD